MLSGKIFLIHLKMPDGLLKEQVWCYDTI